MPYGIKDPSKVNIKGRRLIHTDDYYTCPICKKDLSHRKDESSGVIPLAPIRIPLTDQEGFESIAILGCAQCYTSQSRLSFHTIEALVEYRMTHKTRGRPPGAGNKRDTHERQNLAPEDIIVPRKPGRPKGNSIVKVDLKLLESLYESLGKVIDSIKNIAPEDEVLGDPDLDDDIEAGMTDEQRARMDEAVALAKSREGKVPQEVPNGW